MPSKFKQAASIFLSALSLVGSASVVAQQSSGSFASNANGEASAEQIFRELVGGPSTNCFFKYGPTGRDPLSNRAFPDAGATYWTAVYVRPPGSKVEIEGLYPNARHMSFISYDKNGLYVDGAADYMINPDAGSVNTFRNGIKRFATADEERKYTLEVRLQEKPENVLLVQNAGQPARNHFFALPSRNLWTDKLTSQPIETVMYRIYVQDRGLDFAGGFPVPSVKLTLADGSVKRGAQACQLLRSDPKSPSEVFTPDLSALVMPLATWKELSSPKGVASTYPARYPADWRAAYNPAYNRDQFALKPLDFSDPSVPTPPRIGGAFYPNVFNTYLRTFINREFGSVVVIRLKPWVTPKTLNRGQVWNDKGVDMRFWSISLSESQATTRVGDGVYDEQFPVNSDGYVTFVASNERDRPKFATADCGAAWANWSNRGDGVGNPNFGWLSIRNMLPEPDKTDNFFAFKRPGDEQKILGDHFPQLKYYKDAASFDALGCGGAASIAAMQDIPAKNSPQAVGWPYIQK